MSPVNKESRLELCFLIVDSAFSAVLLGLSRRKISVPLLETDLRIYRVSVQFATVLYGPQTHVDTERGNNKNHVRYRVVLIPLGGVSTKTSEGDGVNELRF